MKTRLLLFLVDIAAYITGIYALFKIYFLYFVIFYMNLFQSYAFPANYKKLDSYEVIDTNKTSRLYRFLHLVNNTPSTDDLFNMLTKLNYNSVSCTIRCLTNYGELYEYELIIARYNNKCLYSLSPLHSVLAKVWLPVPFESIYFIDLLNNHLRRKHIDSTLYTKEPFLINQISG